jgi:hypothetical protein
VTSALPSGRNAIDQGTSRFSAIVVTEPTLLAVAVGAAERSSLTVFGEPAEHAATSDNENAANAVASRRDERTTVRG